MSDLYLEVRKLPNGRVEARRRDGKPLTPDDRAHARRIADAMPGVTVADILRVFPGARVLTRREAEALMAVDGMPQ